MHLASIGHAVVGDDLYGGVRHSFPMPRPFLHARELAFLHPGTGDEVRFDSPLPADLAQVLDRLQLSDRIAGCSPARPGQAACPR